MSVYSSCLSRERFEEVIANLEQLSPEEYQAFENHSEECPACRQLHEQCLRNDETEKWRQLVGSKPAETTKLFGQASPADGQAKVESVGIPMSASPLAGYLGQVGQFHILRQLGLGAMGVVLLARDESLGNLVAIKFLKPELTAVGRYRAAFAREGRKAAAVKHDHVVAVYQAGNVADSGLPYLVMEYLDGRTLSEQLKQEGSLPPSQAAEIARQVASGLAAAHAQQMVHRDIKPSNILLEKCSGRAKIGDFGLARALDGSDALSRSELVVGTAFYMSPEQILSPRQVDERSDIFSLGVVLYQMLTGERPFRGKTDAVVMQQIVHEEPISPRKLNDAVSRDLETITLKCLAKEPARRYLTAQELADDLHRFLHHEPIHARPMGNGERLVRWCRRKPAAAALATCLALLALVIVVGSSTAAFWLRQKEQQKTENLWDAYVAQAHALRLTNQAGRRFDAEAALDKARQLVPLSELTEQQMLDLRNEYIACMSLTDIRVAKEWEGYVPKRSQFAFDSTCTRYARGDEQGQITISTVADDHEILRLPGSGRPVIFLRFSPDGKYLSAIYQGPKGDHSLVWDCEQRQPVAHVPSGELWRWAYSWDSRRLAICRADHSIQILDLASPVGNGNPLPKTIQPNYLAFHPDGKKLALANGGPGIVQVLDINNGKVLAQKPLPEYVLPIAWSAQGKLLAAGCGNRIFLLDGDSLEEMATLEGHENSVIRVAFNHAGNMLASWSWDGTLRLWDLRTNRQLVQTPCGHEFLEELQFSSDDRWLGWTFDGSKVRLWQVSSARECLSFAAGRDNFLKGVQSFSSNGRVLISCGGGTIHFWDWVAGNKVASVPGYLSCFTSGDSLLVSRNDGLYRWQLTPLPTANGYCFEAGSLKPLWTKPRAGVEGIGGLNQDGRCFNTRLNESQYLILDAERPDNPILVDGHPQLSGATISPDGQWLATGTWHGSGVKIWETPTGQFVRDLPIQGRTNVLFSPDGRNLITSTNQEYRFWDVVSWDCRHVIRKTQTALWEMSYSRNGLLLLLPLSDRHLELIETSTNRPLATLEPPDSSALNGCGLSPNGDLLAASSGTGLILVWDLRLIRQHLADKGLDWNLPPYAPASPPNAAAEPLRVEIQVNDSDLGWQPSAREVERLQAKYKKDINDVTDALNQGPETPDLYCSRGRYHLALRKHWLALADLEKAVQLNPKHASACEALAFLYANGPADMRAPEKALPLAQRAVRLLPHGWVKRRTLGLVYFRLGQFDAAVDSLQRSVADSGREATAPALFLLAMSHHRLGDATKARDCYDRAVRWLKSQSRLTPFECDELIALQAEADAILSTNSGP